MNVLAKVWLSNRTMFPSPDTDGKNSSEVSAVVPPGTTEISSAGAAATEVPAPIQPTDTAVNRPASTQRRARPARGGRRLTSGSRQTNLKRRSLGALVRVLCTPPS